MTKENQRGVRIVALFLAITLVQISSASAQQFIARLTTTGNQPISVNRASATSGASLLTGATIETPAGVGATIDLGALGTVELQPNSSIKLDFKDSGNVRAKVLRGCVALKKRGPGEAEIYTAEGASEKTNSKRKVIGFCYAAGKLKSSRN